MLHDKALKKCIAGILVSVMIFVTGISLFSQKAYAYTSWVQGTEAYEELYGEDNLLTEEETDSMDSESEEPKESFVAQQLGAVIYGLGYWITRLSTKGKINLSIDGIVFGKLNQKSGINYFGFDLSPGNPYGIVGATVYTIFRGLCYSGLFILFLYMLAKDSRDQQGISRDGEG